MASRYAPLATFGQVIEWNEKYRASSAALVFGDTTMTHGAFAARSRQLASSLHRAGCRKQDRVAMLAQNSIEQCEIYGANELAGFISAAINFRLTSEEVSYQINDCDARIFLFQEQYVGLVAEIRDRLPDVKQFVCIGNAPDWAADYEAFLAAGDPAGPPLAAEGDDIAYLVYTSGTTGKPKGCVHSHSGHLQTAKACSADVGISRMDRTLIVMPLFHIGGKIVQLATQWRGGTTVVMERFNETEYFRTVQKERATIGHLAPTMIHSLVEASDVHDYDCSSLRVVLYSAAAIPLVVLKRGIATFGRIFHQQYGLTEGAGLSLHKDQHDPDGDETALRRLRSIGIPFAGTEIRIGDENDEPVPLGAPGEILLRTPGMMAGYWNDSVATAEALRNEWLHTGDVGVMDEDGFTYLVDRRKDMIISGGENIYSREVEEVLFQHPDILEAAVISVPDPKWGETVRALIVLREGAELAESDVVSYCRTKMASYKKPRSVVFTTSLPRLANGKYDKVTMRKQFGA